MKKLLVILFIIISSQVVYASQSYPTGYPVSDRTETIINQNWKFRLGEPNAEYFKISTKDNILRNAYVINDKETLLVDLGGKGQLLQFGWSPWIIEGDKFNQITMKPAVLGNYIAGNTPSSEYSSEIVEKGTEGAYTLSGVWFNGFELERKL